VVLVGVDEVHAAFLDESRIRGHNWFRVPEIREARIFPWCSLALTKFMRLSLMKAAYADITGSAYGKSLKPALDRQL
jgi:hypothetical protein